MGFSVNKATVLGNLGRDAEHRFTTNNVCVSNFSIVTEHSYKDNNGDWKQVTNWHNIVAFDLSDYLKDALKKGRKVYLEGRISNTSYDDKEGNKKYKSEIIATKSSIIPLEHYKADGQYNDNQSDDEEYGGAMGSSSDDNEDLPF